MTAVSMGADRLLARFPRERTPDYDLSASVRSDDLDSARAPARRGAPFRDGPAGPSFGGFKPSGAGRALGRNAANDYTEEKTLPVHNGPRTSWRLPRP